jgi:SAM-dependent methyltransferase
MDINRTTGNPLAEKEIHVFKRSLPLQVRLHEIVRAIGKTDGLTCLDIGIENGMMEYHLRKCGGKWHSAVTSEAVAQRIRPFVDGDVEVVQGATLPFKKKVFDLVVVTDYLEKVASDEEFIEECHRILQPAGRLVINVSNYKSGSLMAPLKRLLGVAPARMGWTRDGYTESELFSILKHGFDVHQMRSYSRFFTELTDAFVRSAELKIGTGDNSDAAKQKLRFMAGPFYQVAFLLDLFLLFTRGFYLIGNAKRRAWRPRNAPILSDGRSISEAVLTRPSK